MGAKIITDAFTQAIESYLIGGVPIAAGPLNGAKIGLCLSMPNPTRGAAMSDIVEPGFAGYGRQSITWSAGFYLLPSGLLCVQGVLPVAFKPTNNALPQTCVGYFCCNSGGTTLYWQVPLLNHWQENDPTSFLEILTYWSPGGSQGDDDAESNSGQG